MSSARFYSWSVGTIVMSGGVTFGGSAKQMPRLTGPVPVVFGGSGVVGVQVALSNLVTFTSSFALAPNVAQTVTFTSSFTNQAPSAAGTNQVILSSRFSATDGDLASRRYRR